MLLAIFFIVLGFSIDEAVFQTIGFVFLFFLSATILSPGLVEYKVGIEEHYVYGNNFDGTHWEGYNTTAPAQLARGAYLFHIETSDVYEYANSSGVTWFGRWLALISGLGVALSIANIRSWIKNRRESEEQ